MPVLNRALFALCLLVLVALARSAMAQDWTLVGLGQHQETGRDIYLGGLYLAAGTPRPDDFSTLQPPWKMEYRITARRTSIRSLLGGMLLQSEVATGQSPGPATTEFADGVLSAIRSSLYAGDTFDIEIEGNVTYAVLNGHIVTRSSNPGVARYFLMGWISEQGPARSFRDALLAPGIDENLLAQQRATTYSEARSAEVAGWFDASEPASADTEPVAETPATGEATTGTAAALAPFAADAAGETPGGADEITSLLDAPAQAAPSALDDLTTDMSPVASAPSSGQLALAEEPVGTAEADAALALGVQEYSQRLAAFQSSMVSKVYSKIRYPKRAVRRNLQGRLELDVVLSSSGELRSIEVASTSGHDILDNAAVDAAEEAFKRGVDAVDPVAQAEFGVGPDEIIVPVPVQFRLQ